MESSNPQPDQEQVEADQQARDLKIVKSHIIQLMEHFDSVQIFCTRHEPVELEGGTAAVSSGEGNWYARTGQVREWLVEQDERSRVTQRPAGE